MQQSDMPVKFPIPFGNSASATYKRQVPTASQIGITDGAASLTDGYPPLTATPRSAGGVPPDIRDENGVLFQTTGWARWLAAGGPLIYDSTFATAIGGYPRGAVVQSTVTLGRFWMCTANNNTTDPDGGSPANWMAMTPAMPTIVTNANGTARISPDGFIEQWGGGICDAAGKFIVTFPVPFLVTIYGAGATNIATQPPVAWPGVNVTGLTGMEVWQSSASLVSPGAGASARWWATGK